MMQDVERYLLLLEMGAQLLEQRQDQGHMQQENLQVAPSCRVRGIG